MAIGVLHFSRIPCPAETLTIHQGRMHIGRAGEPEYDIFANPDQPPREPPLQWSFQAATNVREQTLFIEQDDVKESWAVELNGRKLGTLFAMEAPLRHALAVPAGTLRDGDNTLRLVAPGNVDDIVLGGIFLDSNPLPAAINQGAIEVEVSDGDNGLPLPCRLTLVDEDGWLVPLQAAPGQALAVRPGVVYSPNGRARLGLRPGTHTLHATRGFEYGLDTRVVFVQAGQTQAVALRIRREVDTAGWVACDTHTHTFTHSRHGDATTEERVVTLAGEGIELPIATDHNTLTDYDPAALSIGVRRYFTPVVGDEVTTRQAHFNVFPVLAESRVPDFRIQDWAKLLQNIRATPGVKLIVMNHPLNVHNQFQPFAPTNYHSVSGEILQTMDFGFDAMELINSSAQQSDLFAVYRGWFAMLNAGHRIAGVGSSDGHDVSRYIIGQGRTYIACADSDPGRIDVEQACRNLKEGRALVSMGLMVDLGVDGTHRVGDLAAGLGSTYEAVATIQGPTWSQADRIELYANGMLLRAQSVELSPKPGIKARIAWRLSKPGHDIHLVAMATGPGILAPYWAIPRPYQPSSRAWTPRVAGSTNPIWIDGDGDGRFTSAKEYATRLVERHGPLPADIVPALDQADYDEAVAVQVAARCRALGQDLDSAEFRAALDKASARVQKGFLEYQLAR